MHILARVLPFGWHCLLVGRLGPAQSVDQKCQGGQGSTLQLGFEWRTEGETQFEEEGGDLDLEQVRQGREEEMNNIVKTPGMFEFGSWEEVTSNHEMDRVKKATTEVNSRDVDLWRATSNQDERV